MCLIWYKDYCGEMHMTFLLFWNSKFSFFSRHVLRSVFCSEKTCFAVPNHILWKVLGGPGWLQGSPGTPTCLGPVKWNPWNRKIDFGCSRFSTEIPKFWYHDVVMMMVPWSQNLKCPKSDHVKFWESRNPDHVKIWKHQKSDHVKNFDMYQKSDHVKIWETQKSDQVKTENPRSWKVSMLMSSWYHGKLFLAVLVSTSDSWWICELL